MLIELTNDFHGTSTHIRFPRTVSTLSLTPAQVRRIEKRLCGVKECCCSGHLGTRGKQPLVDMEDEWAHIEIDDFIDEVEISLVDGAE